MAPTMKAVVFHGKGDLRFEDVPIPSVNKGQVKVGEDGARRAS
jgi:threonine dehydrogenase-like Zn-dependent dehydrogenase